MFGLNVTVFYNVAGVCMYAGCFILQSYIVIIHMRL